MGLTVLIILGVLLAKFSYWPSQPSKLCNDADYRLGRRGVRHTEDLLAN